MKENLFLEHDHVFGFDVSSVLHYWGDDLDLKRLGSDLKINSDFLETQCKGQYYGKTRKIIAKTSRLSYSCVIEHPEWIRRPYMQLGHIYSAVAGMDHEKVRGEYGVEKTRLQITCVSPEREPEGGCELYFNEQVFSVFSRHRIGLLIVVIM